MDQYLGEKIANVEQLRPALQEIWEAVPRSKIESMSRHITKLTEIGGRETEW
jgi:hypothetical protein